MCKVIICYRIRLECNSSFRDGILINLLNVQHTNSERVSKFASTSRNLIWLPRLQIFCCFYPTSRWVQFKVIRIESRHKNKPNFVTAECLNVQINISQKQFRSIWTKTCDIFIRLALDQSQPIRGLRLHIGPIRIHLSWRQILPWCPAQWLCVADRNLKHQFNLLLWRAFNNYFWSWLLYKALVLFVCTSFNNAMKHCCKCSSFEAQLSK